MVFTKYMSFCLVSPQSGLRPIFLTFLIWIPKIHHLDVFDHPQNNKYRNLRSQARKLGAFKLKSFTGVSDCTKFGLPLVCVTDPRNASKFQQLANIPRLTLVPSLSSNCPLFLSLFFHPPPFPSVLRCRDPSARWCITKDTCSVDVARQIDCVLVSVCVCMCAFINF